MPTNSNEYSDEYYVELSRRGDDSACEYLLDKYKPTVRAVTRSFYLVGADSDDIVQEGMIGLYKAICSYSVDKSVPFAAYAKICIKSQIITAIKNASRMKHRPLNEYVSIEDQDMLSMEVGSPEEQFITEESYEILNNKINDILSKFEIEVLRQYLGGKTYREISEAMCKDIKAIDNALQRTKGKLKKWKE